MTEINARLKEWEGLRAESERKQATSERLAIATIGANFAILAFAINNGKCFFSALIALLPTAITVIYEFWVLTLAHGGFRISRYIKEEIESSVPGMSWERWLDEFSKKEFSKEGFKVDRVQYLARFLYLLSLITAIIKTFDISEFNLFQTILCTTVIFLIWGPLVYIGHIKMAGKIRIQLSNLNKRLADV